MQYLNNLFGLSLAADTRERTLNASIRVFGLDLDIALYGYLNDWVAPIMIVPSLRGLFVQCLFLSVFIGRLKEVAKPGVSFVEEE